MCIVEQYGQLAKKYTYVIFGGIIYLVLLSSTHLGLKNQRIQPDGVSWVCFEPHISHKAAESIANLTN